MRRDRSTIGSTRERSDASGAESLGDLILLETVLYRLACAGLFETAGMAYLAQDGEVIALVDKTRSLVPGEQLKLVWKPIRITLTPGSGRFWGTMGDSTLGARRIWQIGVPEEHSEGPAALRVHGRLQELSREGIAEEPAPLRELEPEVKRLEEILVGLARNIRDADLRLECGLRAKAQLKRVIDTARTDSLRGHRQLAILMFDAMRHVPAEELTLQQISALQEWVEHLLEGELTSDDLKACDDGLLAVGMDSLPDIPED